MHIILTALMTCIIFHGAPLIAGEADVIKAESSRNQDGSYSFNVTVLHSDSGWKHYADKWDIVDEDNNILATRILHHPHVDEQPFTRSLSGVNIPQNVKSVTIRGHDSVHKYGGKTVTIALP